MFTELRKSVNYIIYERTTSPFWGSFIFSWLICNWKIVFTVFVISENQLSINKIDYISDRLIDWKPLILYPFISTAILIVIFPLIGNGAYWITLIYSEWRLRKKNDVEKKQLLSVEASIALRSVNKQLEENYLQSIDAKEAENSLLRLEVKELEKRLSEPTQVLINNIANNSTKSKFDIWKDEFEKFEKSGMISDFETLIANVASSQPIDFYTLGYEKLAFFSGIELIERNGNRYDLTEKGKYFSKLFNENKY
jgi:regulator of replication initiation timing